mmetsp:Transcript_16524/g.19861  ORF Transcript_16524/g.19861 Transcript_16524/m.19861 type:complete len:433 (+) Transcript_16524:28-1326(+)
MAASGELEQVFVCQECQRALKIVERKGVKDSTLQALKTGELPTYLDESHKKKEGDAIKRLAESFVVLSESKVVKRPPENVVGNNTNFHAQVQALSKIFEVVSDKCQVDCPLCDQCSIDLLRRLRDKIRDVEEECKSFQRCIDLLKKEDLAKQHNSEKEKEEEEREKLLSMEVRRQIEEIRKERQRMRKQTKQLEEDSKKLDECERLFWEEYQEYQLELAVLQDTQGALQQKIEITQQQLEQLKYTNVYDDAFYISSKGHFGCINGFKLGRTSSEPVGWDEINAALGQVVLLLSSIAKQVQYEFQTVILQPLGSYSRIADRKSSPEIFNELYNYSSSEFFIRQGTSSSSAGKRFNTALSLLLRAVKELGDYGSRIDSSFKLPKTISGDKIEGFSIQAVAAEGDWTKALKYLLLDLKALLAWCSQHSASGWKTR